MKKGIFKIIYLYSVLLLVIYSAACSKSGDAVEGTKFTLLTLNAITVDSMRLSVTENGQLLTDSLMSPGGKWEMNVKYNDANRQYKVTDMYSNTVLYDSTIHYQKVFNNSVTF